MRVVDEQLTPEIFLGWHATAKQDSFTLVKLLEDSLLRFGMNLAENCVGQALDGAAAMVGRLSGVKTRIKAKYPRALFIYCAGHALNLVIRHAIDDIPACKPSMAVVGSIARHVKRSKGWTEFQEEKRREKEAGAQSDEDDGDQTESEHSESDASDDENEWIRVCIDMIGASKGEEQQKKTKAPKRPKLPTIKLLSETRWICNDLAVDSILKNYKLLFDYFAAKAGVDVDEPDPAEVNVSFDEKTDKRFGLKPAKAREFVNQLDNFGHFYTLRVLSDVYGVVSVLHRLMQSPNLSIIDVRDLISSTKAELKKKADDWTVLVNFYNPLRTSLQEWTLPWSPLSSSVLRFGALSIGT